ncbi:MAG: glycosyltransferase family 4 protein [Bacteroidales bacterium]|nr:glycosyltransferase family 4 protein [Bacteroidales bacterium]
MKKFDKPRVLFVAPLPPPMHGSSMMSMQVKESKAINETFDVDYVNLGTSRSLVEIGKQSYLLYVNKAYRFLLSYFKMLWKLLTHRYDLTYLAITCHDIGFLKDFPFILTARLLSKKYVLHQHNRGMAPYVSRVPYKWLLPMAYNKAKVILLSWKLYEDVSAVVKKEQVLICPNGLPMPKCLSDNVANDNRNEVPEILFLSNLVKSKGVWPLLDALKILKDKSVRFHCSFVGDTSRFITIDKFVSEVKAHGLEGLVEYLGPRYGVDKWHTYKKADVFVLPSMDDCLPLTVIEAMMCGIPVVGSDVGAIVDLVENNVTGYVISHEDLIVESNGEFLDWKPSAEMANRIAETKDLRARGEKIELGSVTLANCLERLLTNSGLRTRMGEAGYEKYQRKFTLEAFECNMIKCLTEALADDRCKKR